MKLRLHWSGHTGAGRLSAGSVSCSDRAAHRAGCEGDVSGDSGEDGLGALDVVGGAHERVINAADEDVVQEPLSTQHRTSLLAESGDLLVCS